MALANRNTSTSLFYILKIVDFLVPDKILENSMVLWVETRKEGKKGVYLTKVMNIRTFADEH